MTFFILNPVISFLVIILIGIAVYMLTKLIDEIVLNKALNLKHQQMRINTVVKGIKARMTGLSVATLVPMAIVVGFIVIGANPTITESNNVLSINSSSDVLSIYESFNEKVNVSNNNWFFRGNDFAIGAPEISSNNLLDSVSLVYTSSGSDDYSGTNNQVIGVDEMDNVLTDGKFIYTMLQNEVQITFAGVMDGENFDASLIELYKTFEYSNETCTEEQFYPQGMFVDDDYLVVIGNQYNYRCNDEDIDEILYDYIYSIDYWYGGYQSSSIKVLVYDKSEDFELRDEYTMDGYFTGTRKITNDLENSLYIVTNNYIPFNDDDMVLDDYLPSYEVNGIEVTSEYEDIIYVEGTSPNSFTTFYGIDLDSKKVDMEVILGDSGYNLYVSNHNMYLVGTTYYFWEDIDLGIDTFATSEEVFENKTAIMKVSIKDAEVEYEGLGIVSGNTLNQFSMDEYEGNLRITTTEGWGDSTNNRLYILDENLDVLSMLENLGKPRERIKSTRFVGDYAYLVTFETKDPFYVIDISDPENPKVDGELIIDGYSAYLQPLGENYILGIGYGDNNGGTNGLKIAIFDVSDKSNPVVLGEEAIFDYSEFGWGSSSATYNHKDLLVSTDKGIIALPFSTSNYSSEGGYSYNSGILVYDFNFTDGLIYSGFVQHEEDSVENIYVYKSKFISEYFYTVSNKYIKVSTLLDVGNILYSVNLED